MRYGIWITITLLVCVSVPQQAQASEAEATNLYLKGISSFRGKQYSQAVRTFNKAYRKLPRHPHFNCRRVQFLNYIAASQERKRQYSSAMRTYYRAAYRSGCSRGNKHSKYAAGRYGSLYNRFMCSINFVSTPPGARIIQITSAGDKVIGKAPFKNRMSPGTYRFKIRLYDHKTQMLNIVLRPGMHIKRNFMLVRGEDPLNRKEDKLDIAPPPSLSGNNNNNSAPTFNKPKKRVRLRALAATNDGAGKSLGGNDPLAGGNKINRVKAGPPIYKRAWFWATVGAVAVGTTAVVLLIPRDQQVLLNQGTLWK